MRKSSTVFLQALLVFIGIGALAFLLGEPHLEGRNKHATLFEIYFNDPLLAFAYFASIPFFVVLYQAFRLIGYAGRDQVFCADAVHALRIIKYCALTMIGLVGFSVGFMPFANPGDDDGPQGIVMRMVIAFGSIIVATAAVMFERICQKAVDLQSENDLTV